MGLSTRVRARARSKRRTPRTWCVPLLFGAGLFWIGAPELEASTAPTSASRSHRALPLARVVTLHAPGPSMIRVPAGKFMMGSPLKSVIEAAELCQRDAPTGACRPRAFADEQPLHSVELATFWLDRSEVTVAAYERCVEQRRCKQPPYSQGAKRFYKPDYPVSLVTWEDAKQFCVWRGARLPTEAEYERASRGLSQRQFPWGDLYNSHVSNHGRYGVAETDARDGFEELAPVGSFPSGGTPDGFMDLAGNVAEWVFDLYSVRYPENATKNPTGPAASAKSRDRVTRGGHFKSAPVWLRGAARDSEPPGERLPQLGFRCAKSG
jgi:formylglycine-generating enzyme required for sulfatase activity